MKYERCYFFKIHFLFIIKSLKKTVFFHKIYKFAKNIKQIKIMSEKIKVYIAMLVAMLFWGFSFIWSSKALQFYNPSTTVIFRLLISSVLLIVINLFFKTLTKIQKKDIKFFIALSFFQPFLYFIGENYGLMNTSSTITSVIVSTIPLFSPIAAYIAFREKISKMNLIGVIISIIGVFLVIIKNDLTFSASAIGLAFLALAVFSAVIYTLIISKLSSSYNVLTLLTYQNLIGIIWFIPTFFILDYNQFIKVGFLIEPFIPIFYLAIFGSTVCYILFIYGVKKLGVTKANIWANIIPVFTAIFAYFFANEQLNIYNIIGIFIVVAGLLLAQITNKLRVKSL